MTKVLGMAILTSREKTFPENMDRRVVSGKAKEWALRYAGSIVDGRREYDLRLLVKQGDRVVLNSEFNGKEWTV